MIRRHAISLIVAITLCGCATAGQQGPQQTVLLDINNNLIPPGPAYIYLVTMGGMERDIGTVFGGPHVIQYRGLPLNGNYQFVARAGSRTISSTILVMDRITGLRWDLERNFIEITRRAE